MNQEELSELTNEELLDQLLRAETQWNAGMSAAFVEVKTLRWEIIRRLQRGEAARWENDRLQSSIAAAQQITMPVGYWLNSFGKLKEERDQLRVDLAEVRDHRDSESRWAAQYKDERDAARTELVGLVAELRPYALGLRDAANLLAFAYNHFATSGQPEWVAETKRIWQEAMDLRRLAGILDPAPERGQKEV